MASSEQLPDSVHSNGSLAEYYGVGDKLFKYDTIPDDPPANVQANVVTIQPNVLNFAFRTFIEIIFENHEKAVQYWQLDGYSFFAVAIEPGRWTPDKMKNYNLLDAVSRNTIHVYPKSWAAIMLTFDNAGMWNLRSQLLERQYLGQQLYVSVVSPARSLRDEYNIPDNALLCGIVKDLAKPNTLHYLLCRAICYFLRYLQLRKPIMRLLETLKKLKTCHSHSFIGPIFL